MIEHNVFVLMPFNEDGEDRYKLAIKAACESLNLNCIRVDEQIFQESILERIYDQILKADIVISDMTERNPNVFFETGYAKALAKKIIFITKKTEDIPFDLRHYPHIVYGSSLFKLKDNLIKHLAFYTSEEELRNFKIDADNISGGIVDPSDWVRNNFNDIITNIFLKTDVHSNQDLVNRLETAKNKFTSFGLTRNFYISDVMYELFLKRSTEILINIFAMDPLCASRIDRYRLEPVEAAMEDSSKYINTIESKYLKLLQESNSLEKKATNSGLNIYYYNFPCSFAIEQIDEICRVMLYGHSKRGTDSPIFVFRKGTPYFDYFSSQIKWLEELALKEKIEEPWMSKKIIIKKLVDESI